MTTLIEYSREVMPLIRTIAQKKELMADFKASDEAYLKLLASVKEAQEACKEYLTKNDDYVAMVEETKEFEKELKLAVKAAARGTAYKPAELKAFFIARNKEEGVVKVICKGELFTTLDGELS